MCLVKVRCCTISIRLARVSSSRVTSPDVMTQSRRMAWPLFPTLLVAPVGSASFGDANAATVGGSGDFVSLVPRDARHAVPRRSGHGRVPPFRHKRLRAVRTAGQTMRCSPRPRSKGSWTSRKLGVRWWLRSFAIPNARTCSFLRLTGFVRIGRDIAVRGRIGQRGCAQERRRMS